MSLLDAIFKPNKNKEAQSAINKSQGFFQTLTAYQPVFTTWQGEIYESEMVRAAIDARARHISKLKIEIRGSAQPSLRAQLQREPNKFMTWSQFLYRTSTILDVNNTAFIVPMLDENLATVGYYPVLPQLCSLVNYKDQPWLKYQFASGQVGAVEFSKVCTLTRHQYLNDFFGDTNDALNETMDLVDIQRQAIKEGAKNSATYRFMATLDNYSTDEDLTAERERFTENNFSSSKKRGGMLLFPHDYKDVKQITQTPYIVDPKQTEQIRLNVCNYFGVSEDVLQSKAQGEALDGFFDGCIEPFSIQLSEGMTKAIFSDRERSQGNEFLAIANRLQYMSVAQKVEMTKELGDRGAMTINEIRELFNYPPLEGAAGEMAPIRGEYYDAVKGKEGE